MSSPSRPSSVTASLGSSHQNLPARLVTRMKILFGAYERNADEFTENMTQVVENLDTVNLTVRARIFSLRGCHLLAMFALSLIHI